MEDKARRRPNSTGPVLQRQPKVPKSPKRATPGIIETIKANSVMIWLLLLVIGGIVLKYFEDYHNSLQRYSHFGDDAYEIMGVPRSATEQEIRAMYRQLNHKWHPDKNPDCADCKEKFMKLKAAYKILGNADLRALYDRTNGRTLEMIPSSTTELTRENFDTLVRNSGDIWVVQVYSDDDPACQDFAKKWEDAADEFKDYAKFGRINELLNPKAMKKLPIKAQLFPTVIMLHPGGSYDIFPQEVLRRFEQFKKHFVECYPSNVVSIKDYSDFKKYPKKRPALLFRNKTGRKSVPVSVKNIAIRYKWAFDSFWLPSEHNSDDDKEFAMDLIESSSEESTLAYSTVMFSLSPSVDTLAIYYAAESGKILATAPFNSGSLNQGITNINAMLTLSQPPLELSTDSFDHLCTNAGSSRDRFCLINVTEEKNVPQQKILGMLASYDHLSLIASAFSTKPQEEEKATPPTASADVQMVHLSDKESTDIFKKIANTETMLLDAKRDKFCFVGNEGNYDCGIELDENLEWVSSLAEGAFDTMNWHDASAAFGGKFKEAALVSSGTWYGHLQKLLKIPISWAFPL